MGALPGAPATSSPVLTNLDSPPILAKVDGVKETNPPLAARDGDQVLPISMTSGPEPLVTLVRIFCSRSDHGITWSFTCTPVCLVKVRNSLVSVEVVWAGPVPSTLAQYVMV